MAPGGNHWDNPLGWHSAFIAPGLAPGILLARLCVWSFSGDAGYEEVAVEQSGEGTHLKTVDLGSE